MAEPIRRHSGDVIIVLSFCLAAVLQILPLSPSAMVGRPMFLGLLVVFWVIALPERFGVFAGFAVGILADVLLNNAMGVNGLAFSLLAFLTLTSHKRLRVQGPLQQSAVVFLLLGIAHYCAYLLKVFLGENALPPMLTLLPVLVSAILWHPVAILMRWVQLRFGVR